jgi:hypothetical protein
MSILPACSLTPPQRCSDSTATSTFSTGGPSQALVTSVSSPTDMIGSMLASMQSGSAELLVFGRDRGTVPPLQRVSV